MQHVGVTMTDDKGVGEKGRSQSERGTRERRGILKDDVQEMRDTMSMKITEQAKEA